MPAPASIALTMSKNSDGTYQLQLVAPLLDLKKAKDKIKGAMLLLGDAKPLARQFIKLVEDIK